ncbi:MAG: hypothetical protein VXY91_03475 [Bacteroidota bacterium]|nr:hypothetical protein [Bacteroidota bacterium]
MCVNSVKNPFALFIFLLSFCSCTVALPEFQTAASTPIGKHKLTVGGFSGRGLNASTGGIAVYNLGLTDQLDVVSITAVSRLNIEQNNIRVATLIGPKWSNVNQKWAFSIPVGLEHSETYNDIDAANTFLLTPTLYKSWNFKNPKITYTFFARSEAAKNFRGKWFSLIGGYGQRYETKKLIHFISVSGTINGPFYGVYFGYGITLKPLR